MSIEALDYDYVLQNDIEADKRLYVKFYMHYVKHEMKSVEAGRLICEDCEYIEIRVPGDKTNIINRAVTEQDKLRFADRYKQFKAGENQPIVGTPLEMWPIISRGQVEELKYYNIHTVEQLSELRDDVALAVPGWATLKKKATIFIEAANEAAPFEKLNHEIEDMKNENASLKQAIAELQLQVSAHKEGGKKAA